MKRREFSAVVLGACTVAGTSLLVSAPAAHAQGGVPVEGKDYQRLPTPEPALANGKIEVIDFFWYGCPHCFAFGPMLDAWAKKLPADVQYRHVPVAFRESTVSQQRMFYALEEMKLIDTMHRRVFAAIHVDHLPMDQPKEIAAWMSKNGVDATKFLEYYNSFSVQNQVRQATRLVQAYHLDGVPTLGVAGRYITSPSMAGSPERALMVASFLIEKTRAKG